MWAADPGAYVDECVAQLVYVNAHQWDPAANSGAGAEVGNDTTPRVLYVLTDRNATVVGLTDAAGRLAAQYSYTPYGELAAAEFGVDDAVSAADVTAAKGNRLGHQGLPAFRFDQPWPTTDAGGVWSPLNQTSSPSTYFAVYHNRNRMYRPDLGRFDARDPNGLGGINLSVLGYGGMMINASYVTTDILLHYGAGMNTHIAYSCSPQLYTDPMGLVPWYMPSTPFLPNQWATWPGIPKLLQSSAKGFLLTTLSSYIGATLGNGMAYGVARSTGSNGGADAAWEATQNAINRRLYRSTVGLIPYGGAPLARAITGQSPSTLDIVRGIATLGMQLPTGSGLTGNFTKMMGSAALGWAVPALIGYSAAMAAVENGVYYYYAELGLRGEDLKNAVPEY